MELPCLIVREAPSRGESSKHPSVLCEQAGRRFSERARALILPAFKPLVVKRITPEGRNRVRVQVKGVPERLLVPGSVIVGASCGIYRGRIGYALPSVPVSPGTYTVRGGLYWGCPLPGTVAVERAGSACRIESSEELPLIPGAKYELYPTARGSRHVAELILVLPAEPAARGRKRAETVLDALTTSASRVEIYRTVLDLIGWVELLPDFRALGEIGGTPLGGCAVAREQVFDRMSAQLLKEVRSAGGCRIAECAESLLVSESFAESLVRELARRGRLRFEGGLALPSLEELPLSPAERQALEELSVRDAAGRSIGSIGRGAERTRFARLNRLGAVTKIGGRYLHWKVVERLERTVQESSGPDGRITVALARSATGLPIPGVLDLLDRLTERGAVERLPVGWRRVAHEGAHER